MADEEGGRGIRILMCIVGSGRGSLFCGSGRITLLGESVESGGDEGGGGRVAGEGGSIDRRREEDC